MSRTCKRVVYKKVKRSCKNALVGGAGFFTNNNEAVKVAVNAFTVAIAKLIPVKEQQNKIEASKYYEQITIDDTVFDNNIILYAFIILYCAVVHNFKIDPSDANKRLIVETGLIDLLIKVANTYKSIKILLYNKLISIDIIGILAKLFNDFNTKLTERLGSFISINNIITPYIFIGGKVSSDIIMNNSSEEVLNKYFTILRLNDDAEKSKHINEMSVSKIVINIPKPKAQHAYHTTHHLAFNPNALPSTNSVYNPNKFENHARASGDVDLDDDEMFG